MNELKLQLELLQSEINRNNAQAELWRAEAKEKEANADYIVNYLKRRSVDE